MASVKSFKCNDLQWMRASGMEGRIPPGGDGAIDGAGVGMEVHSETGGSILRFNERATFRLQGHARRWGCPLCRGRRPVPRHLQTRHSIIRRSGRLDIRDRRG